MNKNRLRKLENKNKELNDAIVLAEKLWYEIEEKIEAEEKT